MAKNLFARYIWEVTTIYNAGAITLRGINAKWADSYLFDGKEIPRKTCYGIIARAEKVNVVKLKVSDNQQKFFRSLPLHHSQKEIETKDDYSVFEYYIQPTFDFRQTILSFADSVEVLEPQWLRNEIAEKVKKMAAMY